MQYSRFDSDQVNQSNSKSKQRKRQTLMQAVQINDDSLDIKIEDDKSMSYFTPQRIYKFKAFVRLIVMFFICLIPIYFYFIFYSICKISQGKSTLNQRLYLLIDAWSAFCVIFIFQYFLFHTIDSQKWDVITHIYWYWSVIGVILHLLFTISGVMKISNDFKSQELKQAENEAEKSEVTIPRFSFKFNLKIIFNQHSLYILGLGILYTHQIKNPLKKTNEWIKWEKKFGKQIEKLVERDNIDPTLTYFTLIKEQQEDLLPTWYKFNPNKNILNKDGNKSKNVSDIQKAMRELADYRSQGEFSAVQSLQNIGFKGCRSIIKNFLIPNFLYIKKNLIQDNQMIWIFGIILLLIKIVMPTALLLPINIEVIFLSLILSGFYSHFANIIYYLALNDDLKIRNLMLLAIARLIDVQQYMTDEDEKSELIDVSCPLSLQSWDNMRHLVLQLEHKQQTNVRFVYIALVLYGKFCFLAFFLCRFNIPLFEQVTQFYCSEKILTYNIHIDLAIVCFICLTRHHEGQKYNDTFKSIIGLIHRLSAIYDDLYTLFDYYFSLGISQRVQNECYQTVIMLIKQSSERKIARMKLALDYLPSQDQNDLNLEPDYHDEARLKIKEMREALEKIKQQVHQDSRKHLDKFLGIYQTEFKTAIKIMAFVIVSFVPALSKKVMEYISKISGG